MENAHIIIVTMSFLKPTSNGVDVYCVCHPKHRSDVIQILLFPANKDRTLVSSRNMHNKSPLYRKK